MDVQHRIRELKAQGWTIAAIADGLGLHWNTVANWERGRFQPESPKMVMMALQVLAQQEPPKKKRYTAGA